MVRRSPCKLNISCALTTAESRAKIWYQYNAFKPSLAYVAVRSKAVVLLLLTYCLLLLPLWEAVIVLCFVVRIFMFILVLQTSWWGRLLSLSSLCLVIIAWLVSRYHGFVCSLWLWYFLIILTNYFYNMDIMRQYACLVVNPITVQSYGFLFNCTTVGQASDSMMALT